MAMKDRTKIKTKIDIDDDIYDGDGATTWAAYELDEYDDGQNDDESTLLSQINASNIMNNCSYSVMFIYVSSSDKSIGSKYHIIFLVLGN